MSPNNNPKGYNQYNRNPAKDKLNQRIDNSTLTQPPAQTVSRDTTADMPLPICGEALGDTDIHCQLTEGHEGEHDYQPPSGEPE